MRALSIIALLGVAAVANAAEDKKDNPTSEKADIKLTVPKELEFTKATKPGGKTAEFKVDVEIKNGEAKPLPFSVHYLDFDIVDQDGKSVKQPLGWGWDKPDPNVRDALVIDPDKTHKVTRSFTFNTGTPKDGDKLTVVLKLYGQTKKETFTAKTK